MITLTRFIRTEILLIEDAYLEQALLRGDFFGTFRQVSQRALADVRQIIQRVFADTRRGFARLQRGLRHLLHRLGGLAHRFLRLLRQLIDSE